MLTRAVGGATGPGRIQTTSPSSSSVSAYWLSANRKDDDVDEKLKQALTEYAIQIHEEGFDSGERLIKYYEAAHIPDFRRWAYACGIMLRAEEILEERDSAGERNG